MLQDILSIGDKIEVNKLDHMGKPIQHHKTGISQLIDFKENQDISIAMPMVGSRIQPMEIDTEYCLCFYTGKGLYQCNCIVIEHFRENHMIATTVRITSALEKYQRRQYYRLECMIDIQYRLITNQEVLLETKLIADKFPSPEAKLECQNKLRELTSEYVPGVIVDISGGGIRFNSKNIHQCGDKLSISLEISALKGAKKYILSANVVSSNKIINKIDSYEHRVEFNDIDKKEREEIIRYIFEQERQRRQLDFNRNK